MSSLRNIPSLQPSERMPLLFLGHGSPMNAIEENEFVKGFRKISETIPLPRAILCVSAHWETSGTHVTINESPRTIHDFGGFPPELYEVRYPAPGSPSLAGDVVNTVSSAEVMSDTSWGLDHGAWSVLKHLYPNADIPVVQLSLDYNAKPGQHYAIASELKSLRDKGVLIAGSGNIVHNLGLIDWRRMKDDNFGFDWAVEANNRVKELIEEEDHSTLISLTSQKGPFRLAIPTPEHYLPLLYVLALQGKNENVTFFNDKAVAGSLTMTSVKIG